MGNVKIVAASILFVFSANGYCGTIADVAKAAVALSVVQGTVQTNVQQDDSRVDNRATASGKGSLAQAGPNNVVISEKSSSKVDVLIQTSVMNDRAQMSNRSDARGGGKAQTGGNNYLRQ